MRTSPFARFYSILAIVFEAITNNRLIAYGEIEIPDTFHGRHQFAMNLLAPSIACRATSERRCVDMCQDWLAVNVDNKTSPLDGQVLIYTRFRPDQTPPMRRILQQTGA